MSHFVSNLQQEAKHIPVAERVMRGPSKEKEHTLDINASRLCSETPELHAEWVRIVAMYSSHIVRWEGNRWLRISDVLHLMLQACYYMQKGLGREAIKFGMQRMRKKQHAPKHM